MRSQVVEVREHFDPDGNSGYGIRTTEIVSRPFFTVWDARAVRQMHEAFKPEQLGYRFVDRTPSMMVSYYARPWPLWAVLRLRVKVRDGFWRVMRWMESHGWLHLASGDGARFRWRDVRFGRG
jgi:hypothetical protein